MKTIFNYTYGFISIGVIEFGQLINTFSNIFDLLIILLQVVIAVFTIKKLYSDIKGNKYKSIDKTEKELQRKKPFLYAVLEYFKTLKK